jgi:hypothetical protein
MSNEFRGEGNLGVQPTLKKVLVDGEPWLSKPWRYTVAGSPFVSR